MELTPEEQEVYRCFESGELYRDYGPDRRGLEAERFRAKELAFDFNSLRPSDAEGRARVLKELLGSVGEGVFVEGALNVAYGTHTHMGDHVYINFGLKIIDDSPVVIGNQVMIGPDVTLSTAGHPIHPELRTTGLQFSKQITIEDRVWLGAGAVVLPGVTIGYGSVVAAGAVVTGNVPPMTVVGGVPARIIRPIVEADNEYHNLPTRDLK